MLISIHDVPACERHLLFCSNLRDVDPEPQCPPASIQQFRPSLPAINRSLSVHGENIAGPWATRSIRGEKTRRRSA